MIVDIRLIQAMSGDTQRFQEKVMMAVRDYQKLGHRVEIQYSSDYTALVIARECNWIGNNS